MARIDYEAAFQALMAHVATKTSHGREELLVKMAELADAHKIPEDLLEKAARIAGGIPVHTPETRPSSSGDREIVKRMDEESPATDGQGGHDGTSREARGRSPDPVRA